MTELGFNALGIKCYKAYDMKGNLISEFKDINNKV